MLFCRIIRSLCAFGVFREILVETECKYGLTRLSNLLRDDMKGQISVKNECQFAIDPECLAAWGVFEKCVRSEKHLVPCSAVSESSHPSHEHEHEHEHTSEHTHGEHYELNVESLTLIKYYSHGFKELEARKAHILDLGESVFVT